MEEQKDMHRLMSDLTVSPENPGTDEAEADIIREGRWMNRSN